jgi:nicotinamide-nucleotide amidase
MIDPLVSTDILATAGRVLDRCRQDNLMIATAESCTGGLIVASLTALAGSSDVIDRGFVTYSNAAKSEMLGVDPALIELKGAVSPEVAAAMAEGALARSKAGLSVSVTGIAGPGGGSDGKPVGLVYFGIGRAGSPVSVDRKVFAGDRTAVRTATVIHALNLLARQNG